ncbi:hypothetical protein AB0L13_46115 [Saccharopolyspora shandongensis]|uniref:creatininase family protein n=1 Tax=Saccharopolyspora shandongensis TaxID=418495 RepID=UPI003441C5D7
MLHAAPSLVRDGYETADHRADERPDLLLHGLRAYTSTGVVGQPSLASAQKGAALLDAFETNSPVASMSCVSRSPEQRLRLLQRRTKRRTSLVALQDCGSTDDFAGGPTSLLAYLPRARVRRPSAGDLSHAGCDNGTLSDIGEAGVPMRLRGRRRSGTPAASSGSAC